jgi:hypothetical protein
MISNGTAEQAIAKAKGEPQSEPNDPEEPGGISNGKEAPR